MINKSFIHTKIHLQIFNFNKKVELMSIEKYKIEKIYFLKLR